MTPIRIRPLLRIVVPTATVLAMVAFAEVWFTALERVRSTRPDEAHDAADRRYVPAIPLASGVDPAWYDRDPPPVPGIPLSDAMAARAKMYVSTDPYGAFFAWNRAYLQTALCAGITGGSLGILDDFYVFDQPDGSAYPTYRHLSYVTAPGGFPSNRFGWRGPDVTLNKPPNTIRMAFVGGSTTIDPYYLPFSHVELVGLWLNLWMDAQKLPYRVEVINGARTGIDSPSIAAIVVQEVVPLEPDLVVYDGASSFRPFTMLHLEAGVTRPQPVTNIRPRWSLESSSALVRRVRVALDRWNSGSEPGKPPHPIDWPSDVDEQAPDIHHVPLPMALHAEVHHFDTMRTALHEIGSELALASFVWMVQDHMRLDLERDLPLYNFLNLTYWPLRYQQLRRLADFQNRVFERYARAYNVPFFDVAARSPLDPLLFGDAVHMSPRGLRLQAWIGLQQIVPWLHAQIAQGRLPRAMQHPREVHPAFTSTTYPLVSKAEILSHCPR